MTVSEIMKKMMDFSEGNLHDINHFMKVYGFAKTIGELEKLDGETQFVLEVAAITHDIACPLCREKYGSTNGKYQEQEGMPLVRAFLADAENQNTLKLLLGQVFKLIKHILPREIRGRVRFGFEDPYTTGQVLTYISPFYGLYANTVEIEPVFDEKVMEGELHLKGHIRLGALLWIVVRVFLNKNFRKLLKSWSSKGK